MMPTVVLILVHAISSIGSGAIRLYSETFVGVTTMFRLTAALTLALMSWQPAIADGMRYSRHRHYHQGHYLPPERHVIEVVRPPYSGNLIINGTRFTAKTATCLHWTAGDRIPLIAGDWNGRCIDAVFYNLRRRNSCAMWCG
jgi:hypothetical protein